MGEQASRRGGPDLELTKRRKKPLEQGEYQSEESLVAAALSEFDNSQPQEEHSFEKPAQVPDDLKEAYEEHKKGVSGYRPWVPPPLDIVEERSFFQRVLSIPKGRRANPAFNPDIMPEKEIVNE